MSQSASAVDCNAVNLPPAQAAQCGASGAAGRPAASSESVSQASQAATKSLNTTIKNILNILSVIVGVVAVIMIIISGFRYVVSSGKQENVAGAKNTILYAIIGLIIVALAQIIVHFVLKEATGAASGKPWAILLLWPLMCYKCL